MMSVVLMQFNVNKIAMERVVSWLRRRRTMQPVWWSSSDRSDGHCALWRLNTED